MSKILVREAIQMIVSDDEIGLVNLLNNQPELLQHQFLGGKNWLHKAAISEAPSAIKALAEYYEDIDAVDNENRTPLVIALATETNAAAKTFIELGSNVNHGGQYSPLSSAVFSNNKELLKLLIENGANNESKEELISYGHANGYKNIEQDLAELNYSPIEIDIFKDKLAEKYGELDSVKQVDKHYKLYFKERKNSFTVFSENLNLNAEVLFDIDKFGLDSVNDLLTENVPWLINWLNVINQVEIDPTQRFIVVERDSVSKPYQGVLLLQDAQVKINSSTANIYRLFPLHQAEVEFEKQNSMVDLIKEFERAGLSEVIVNNRQSII